ncbi:2'-5' RNA ligase family protein [Chryseobacterium caseinilyticum]|uniref:2'-5' RNA ligase family protein n=1 Tax=Chryseobacterium caseinilyticum TaxID=2771428 RepID=A0ABR8Z6X5_9FLAO|nr:2'-5' RNA ligase family protein [Chryseobacterium caseinilyticum]MBD8081050.1 2'-5' RNA ligase family protein [Chryseobacterium caseinilyticum]
MNHVNHYSIVILPPDEVNEKVDELKRKLFTESGKEYSSRKSIAHITVQEFWATENKLNKIILKLIKVAREQKCFPAEFDKVICSEQTAFFSPNANSKNDLEKFIKRLRSEVKGHITSNAHISIGRKLSPQQIEISRNIFSNETLNFECNRIALRKLNDTIKQFEVVQIFPFLGKELAEKQLTLW